MSATASRYIAVPVPIWEPRGRPVGEGSTIAKPPAPEGAGVGGGASLVQDSCITDTPFLIADAALTKLFNLPKGDWRHAYDRVCYDFVQYLDRCEQKGFHVKGYDTKKGKITTLPLEYNNRWGHRRRMELKSKLDRLEYWFDEQADRPVTMITLTCYHEGVSIPAAWHALNDSRTKLLKLIRKYFGDVDYFWVPEPHKSGYVHYHLAVFADVSNNVKDNQGKGIEDKFRDLWSRKYKTGSHTYGLDFSQKKNDDKIQHLKNYLSKYLSKGFAVGEWSIGLLLFNAHLWETGFRMYGASKRIRDVMNFEDEDRDQPIVWLETKVTSLEQSPEGEEIWVDRVIWYRQYIPDWIDCGDLWLDKQGKVRCTDPPPLYLYDWGRKASYSIEREIKPVTVVKSEPERQLTPRQLRKLEQDGYL